MSTFLLTIFAVILVCMMFTAAVAVWIDNGPGDDQDKHDDN